jgi:CubicO group peptidase (beta-lactamase class C family)
MSINEPVSSLDIPHACLARHAVPGVSLAVIDENRLAWAQGYGLRQAGRPDPVTPEMLFQACSISKAVTAVAALKLVEAGQLALDEDVNYYLRTWQVPASGQWQPKVTLRQLLSHTAGVTVPWFAGYHRAQQLPTLQQILQGDRPANTPAIRVSILPGSRYRYSGGGYCIIQQLLCEVTGQSFPALMYDLVLGPAGMTHSQFTQPLPATLWVAASTGHRADGHPVAGQWHVYPELAAAGLWTTATDLARFAIELQLAYAGQPNALLSPPTAQVMLTPQAHREDGGQMGLGIWLDGAGDSGRFGHPGDNEGFVCHWVSLRSGGNGAVVMANADSGWSLVDEILQEVAQAYDWPAPGVTQPMAKSVAVPNLDAYTGMYGLDTGFTLVVIQQQDRLWLHTPGQTPLLLTPIVGDTFRLGDLEGEVTFLRSVDGLVDGLQLQQDGQVQTARKQIRFVRQTSCVMLMRNASRLTFDV